MYKISFVQPNFQQNPYASLVVVTKDAYTLSLEIKTTLHHQINNPYQLTPSLIEVSDHKSKFPFLPLHSNRLLPWGSNNSQNRRPTTSILLVLQ
jgi:hypothetical protein